MNWVIKIISKALMTKISHTSWGSYDKGFYGNILYIANKIWLLFKDEDFLNFSQSS